MTDKEKIIAYIDKLLEKYPKNYYLLTVAEFIDSIQKEPISEDLEKEINKFFKDWGTDEINGGQYGINLDVRELKDIARHFANWQKEQMMAKAVDAQCFGFQGAALFSFRLPVDNYLVGSEVKIIVIKED
jgi:hypothetical protein